MEPAPPRSRRARLGLLALAAVAVGLVVRPTDRRPVPPGAKADLLAAALDAPLDLAAYRAADDLAEDAVAAAADAADPDTLTRLADLGDRMRVALFDLRARDPAHLPDDRFTSFLDAIDGRGRRAWSAVREAAPDRPAAYRGLARLALRAADPDEAAGRAVAGLAACGDRPELREVLAVAVARLGDESRRSLADSVLHPAADARTDPVKWCVAAEVALVSDDPDVALAACGKAREVDPGHRWACAAEARVRVRAGDFRAARDALAALGDAALLDPDLARLHARVVVGSGRWAARDEEFGRLRGDPAVGFLLGVLDAPPDADRSAWVADRAGRLSADRVRALALSRFADPSAALAALDALPRADRAEPEVAAAAAALRLRGSGDAAGALRAAVPLLAEEPTLSAGPLEVLGAVLAGNGRPADAVRVLERAAGFPRPSAGCLAALAVAYHRTGQPAAARFALRRAELAADRSARESELAAARSLLGEGP
ncbi:MAG: hypothetical protein C0501_10630 [Isosphaera sp.]|nr:hypothetical protein [Isosphaera sp.]